MENEKQADPINDETEMKGGSESGESMEYVRVDCANETEEADLEEGKQNECVPVEDPVSDGKIVFKCFLQHFFVSFEG